MSRFVFIVSVLLFFISFSLIAQEKETKPVQDEAKPGQIKVDEFNDAAKGDEKPVKGDWIRVAYKEPKNLNPITSSDSYETYINMYILEQLIRQDNETFEYKPCLAESWDTEDLIILKQGGDPNDYLKDKVFGKVTDKGDLVEVEPVSKMNPLNGKKEIPKGDIKSIEKSTVYTFYIRKGVKWHDGAPFNAHDVTFSYKIIKNEFSDCDSLRVYYKHLEYCQALDDFTVRMIYGEQYFKALEFTGGMYLVPRHIYEVPGANAQEQGKAFNNHDVNYAPIGTGPYKFEKWERGQYLDAVRNDEYWDTARKGYLNKIRFKFIKDEGSELAALTGGEVDFIPRMLSIQYNRVTDNPEFKKRFAKPVFYTGYFSYIGWNLSPDRKKTPFLREKEVRKALAMLFPKERILKEIYYGRGKIVSGPQYYFGPGYDHSINPLPDDPEGAEELLVEAGWYDRDGDGIRDKDDVPFKFTFLTYAGVVPPFAIVYQEELKKAGIQMEIRQVEWATFLETIEKKDFDSCSLAWAMPIESDPYQIWHSDGAKPDSRGSNKVSYANKEIDDLIIEGRKTIDKEKRCKIWHKMHAILHEDQPYLFMYCMPSLASYEKRFRGVKFYRLRPGYDLGEWFVPQELQKFK